MREFRVLHIKTKLGKILLIPSHNINYVEEIENAHSRIYYFDKVIDIDRDIDWMRKFLIKGYDESTANEI